jgi:GcrA cell cycle regulator
MLNHVEALGASTTVLVCPIVTSGWTPERVELLKRLAAWNWLSASQIATELGGGLTRNAVIGKLNRLKLSIAKPNTCRNPAPRGERKPRGPRPPRAMTARALAVVAARALKALEAAVLLEPPATAIRSVLELRAGVCRYPFGDPGHPSFCFCGAGAIKPLPYCAGHARLSYRPGAR